MTSEAQKELWRKYSSTYTKKRYENGIRKRQLWLSEEQIELLQPLIEQLKEENEELIAS